MELCLIKRVHRRCFWVLILFPTIFKIALSRWRHIHWVYQSDVLINPFHFSVSLLYPLKTEVFFEHNRTEKRFSFVFRGYRSGTLVWIFCTSWAKHRNKLLSIPFMVAKIILWNFQRQRENPEIENVNLVYISTNFHTTMLNKSSKVELLIKGKFSSDEFRVLEKY